MEILIFICVLRKNKAYGNDNGRFNWLLCVRPLSSVLVWLPVLGKEDLDTDLANGAKYI